MGEKTVEINDKLRDALARAISQQQQNVFDGDPGPFIARLEQLLDQGDTCKGFWAFFAHGNHASNTSDFVAGRRKWYEWTKSAEQMTAIAYLTPDELRAVLYADGAA